MNIFNLPDLGEGLKEAEIIEWHVNAGDEVSVDDPLVSVETDKAIADIPSPRSGRIEKLFAAVGDIVATGKPLVAFAGAGDSGAKDTGTVVGEVESGEERVEERAEPVSGKTGAAVRATPSVRALARQMEVDLGVVSPSGSQGNITAEDVKRVAKRLGELGPIEILHGVRRVMAIKMTQSGAEVVPATITDDADVDHWPGDTDATTRLLLAIVAGCKAEPALNAWFDSHSMGRRVLRNIDIAVAVDTDEGLFTPVVRDAANHDYGSLKARLEKLKANVRTRSVPVREMRGYTITLSNFGMIGGRYAVPVVVPPTVAIVAAGRIEIRPVVVAGTIEARRILPLSLSFDHRAVTGGESARFMAAVIDSLEAGDG